VIVDSAVYRGGERVPVDCHAHDFRALRDAASAEGGFVWVGLHAPSHVELGDIATAFDLHQLAVEDAVTAHQRPKLEQYDDMLFLVLKTLWYVDAEDAVETGEINLFIGTDYVITVRHGSGGDLRETRAGLEQQATVLGHGPSSVVYAVCDAVVDRYLSVLEELQTDVDEVETSVFSAQRTNDELRIYTLKREIAEVRRAVLPLREPMRRFAAGVVTGIHADTAPYFRDVGDHLSQASETVDSLDTLLSSAFEAYLARVTVQQNDDMRKISAGAALVLVPTLIAGIYGMNFELTPSPNETFGFWFALSLMGASAAAFWLWFKRSGWF
jgi:magnesium transporter